jgi:plastocyanin
MAAWQQTLSRLSRSPLPLLAAGVVLVIGGCGGGGDVDSAATAPSPATSSAATGGDKGTVINVDERDFSIEIPSMELAAGTYTFVATNSGQTTHALEIEGQGIEEETADLAPGDEGELTVTLEPGEYELYCPVDDHKDMGMKVDLTVK